MKRSVQPRPRLSGNHQAILEVLVAHGRGKHLTTGDVYEAARKLRPSIGFSTVYRGLLRLRDLGLASEILIPGAPAAVYEPMAADHAHFRCEGCGAVHDVEFALSKRTLRSVEGDCGFEIDSALITLLGRCKRCK